MTLGRNTRLLLVLALLAIVWGIGVRAWNIASEPLWLDEAYSAYAAGKGFAFLWQVVPRYETHPPFYYSLLRLWTLAFGDSLGALRALGLLCGLATLPMVAVAAREIGRYLAIPRETHIRFAAIAVALVALSPMLAEMTREVRPYPLMMLVMSMQVALLFRLGIRAQEGRALWGRSYAGYLLLLALTLWLHNLGALHAGAMGLAFLLLVFRRDWNRSDWIAFLVGHLAVAAIWAPAIWILVDQAPAWVKTTWLSFSWWLVGWGMGALWAAPTLPAQLAATGLFLLAIAGLSRRPRGERALLALVLLAAAPLIVAILLSLSVAPVFIPRTMTPVAIPAMLLLALGVALAPARLRLLGIAALMLLAVQMGIYGMRTRQSGSRYDYHGAVEWLASRFRPGDLIIAYPNEGALPLGYALRDKGLDFPMTPVPTPVPTLDGGPGSWYRSGSRGVVSLNRARLEAIAADPALARVPTVWLYRLGPKAYDKGDHFVHALDRTRDQVGHYEKGPINIVGFRLTAPRDAQAGPPASP